MAKESLRLIDAMYEVAETAQPITGRAMRAPCAELDAMELRDLRQQVVDALLAKIEPAAWTRYVVTQEAEQEALQTLLDKWRASA